MAKKKVEIEIEYPDCIVCGEGVFDGEEYYELVIWLEKFRYNKNLKYLPDHLVIKEDKLTEMCRVRYHKKCDNNSVEKIIELLKGTTEKDPIK